MRSASIGKWLALGGIVVLVLSITPTGEFIDPHDAWWSTRWQWVQHALRQDHAAPAVTLNPLLLYLGMLLSVSGLAVAWGSDRGASTARAAQQRASQAARAGQIFVSNVAYTTTRDELRQLFEAYGEVERVHLMTERETGRSRGFAFVTMANAHEARAAIAELQGTTLGGRMLTVSAAHPRAAEERPRRPR
jgi:RNA recognition motif. (a.k.a. RRM, RBD, or RNP domain)